MNDPVTLGSAFIIGLLGGAHCIGMCGGIVNALSLAIRQDANSRANRFNILLLYNLGRISSYVLVGVLIGLLSALLQEQFLLIGVVLRFLSGLLLIALGLYLAGWWWGLRYLERFGSIAWSILQPLANRLLPVRSVVQALPLGMVWGWFPCGMVYSVLTWSATAEDWKYSALVMLFFGLGTLPVMLLTGELSHKLKAGIQNTYVRRVAGLVIIFFGLWATFVPFTDGKHDRSETSVHNQVHH
ncbi:MAG: sulfite exporter TauE/SafE family protein [Gammaproteobacteria bacterium]|nr:sulfite exporter TauE/SafE family protein [Gammaproteobacteria bacterium]